MSTKVELHYVLGLCDPRKSWPWGCPAPSEMKLQELLKSAEEVRVPVSGEGTAEDHVGRIIFLARHGWSEPIEIDVGIPCIGYAGPRWAVTDGNHRLWAAAIRGDTAIEVDVAGQVDHAARVLGVGEEDILAGRIEHSEESEVE